MTETTATFAPRFSGCPISITSTADVPPIEALASTLVVDHKTCQFDTKAYPRFIIRRNTCSRGASKRLKSDISNPSSETFCVTSIEGRDVRVSCVNLTSCVSLIRIWLRVAAVHVGGSWLLVPLAPRVSLCFCGRRLCLLRLGSAHASGETLVVLSLSFSVIVSACVFFLRPSYVFWTPTARS